MQEDITVLWQSGTFCVTTYSLMMVLGAALGVLLTLLLNRKRLSLALSVCLSGVIGAVLGGHLLWSLFSLGKLPDYTSGYALLWQPQLGGYCLVGAVAGLFIALLLCALLTKQPPRVLFDMAVPGSLLALCVGRAAEAFTTQGLGEYIEDEALMRFPCGIAIVYEDWVDWRVPVFVYEAMTAALLLILALVLMNRLKRPGRLTGIALTVVCATQIFFEQLRNDDYLRFGFVRVTQVSAILAMLAVLLLSVYAAVKRDGWRTASVLRLVLLPLCALTVIFIEFAFEKGWVKPYLCITLLVTAAVGACALIDYGCALNRRRARPRAILCFLLMALEVAFSIWVVWAIHQEFEWENMMLYGVMAAAMATATATTTCGTCGRQ